MTDTLPDVLTLEELLQGYGPYFNGGSPPSNDELFAKLEAFGQAVWRLPRPTEREYGIQIWTSYVSDKVIPRPMQPWRVVREAVMTGAPITSASPWRWYDDTELAELPPTQELVRGHLPERGLVLLYGPSGDGKTFVGLDLAFSVATGTPWHGHSVEQGPVAYIIAEGAGGGGHRVQAWKQHHAWTGLAGVRFLPQPVHFLEPAEAARLVAELQAWDPAPKLVVVDTLGWCMAPGDENSTKDMSQYVAAIGELRAATGATVLTVHHTGHDTSRERGNTALKGAMDTVVKVKQDDETITVSCDKQREAVPFPALRFRLEPVAESVVPVRLAPEEITTQLTKNDRAAWGTLRSIDHGQGVPNSEWHQQSGLAKTTFNRCRKKLVQNGYVKYAKRRYFAEDSLNKDGSATEVPF